MALSTAFVPTDIWSWPERPQTLADTSFAPTSINHVEFPDDLGPVAYQANRAAMASNGKGELEELEARNQRTTAYPSVGCVAGPMSPDYSGGKACDINAMQERSHGITAYTTQGAPVMHPFNVERSAACAAMETSGIGLGASNPGFVARASGEPPIGYAPQPMKPSFGPRHPVRVETKKTKDKIPFGMIPMRTLNSVRGALYDLKHFNELPAAQNGESPSGVAMFALTRDNRAPYLCIAVVVVLILTAVIILLRNCAVKKKGK